MRQELDKFKVKRPTGDAGQTYGEFADVRKDVPEVTDILDEIDKVLERTKPKKQKIRLCGC